METSLTTNVFARNLSSLLSESEKTMKIISDEIGISVGALSNYQNNRATANIDALRKIAQYFNVSADWLIGLSNAPSPNIGIQEMHKKTGLWEDAIIRLSIDRDIDNIEISDFISYLTVNGKISKLISAIKGKNKYISGPKVATLDVDGEEYPMEIQTFFKMVINDLFWEIIEGYIAKPDEVMVGYRAGENNG